MSGKAKTVASKSYNSVDILKLILAVFVMMIHSALDKTVISPLLRIAVPLFFIISSYFFFAKEEKLDNAKDKYSALRRMAKRNLALYLIWAIVQLPVSLYVNDYLPIIFNGGIFYALRDVIFGNGFTGSWYIPALVIGIIAVFFLSKKISAGWLICITLPFYIISCVSTNYRNIAGSDFIIVKLIEGYYNLTGCHFHTSFPVSLFWVSIGNFLAKKQISAKNGALFGIGAVTALLLGIERYLIVKNNWGLTDDCYLMLILLCPIIFLLVKKSNFTFNSPFRIRELSVIIYVAHGACGRIVGFVLKKLPFGIFKIEMVKIFITFLLLTALAYLILYLKDRLKLKVLKYVC